MKLNDRQIKTAKSQEKSYKLSDGKSLYLLVHHNGGKYWRMDYAFQGKRKTLAIGVYPDISLQQARLRAEEARQMIANGINPVLEKQERKKAEIAVYQHQFEKVAREWHKNNLNLWKPNHALAIMRLLEREVFPMIGALPIYDLNVSIVRSIIDRLIEREVYETADKVRQYVSKICDYACMCEIMNANPISPLKGYVKLPPVKNMPALPYAELEEFYYRLLTVSGIQEQNRIAILLLMLVFVRNNELRGAKWAEIDLDKQIWVIPPERMKLPRPHIVFLSDWAIELLQSLHELTGKTEFLFPSRVLRGEYISEATLNKIINNMGYKGIATPHGFRSLASSTLNEQGFNADAIERQLAHVENNRVRAAYLRADFADERRRMMQWYSDHLKGFYQGALSRVQVGADSMG